MRIPTPDSKAAGSPYLCRLATAVALSLVFASGLARIAGASRADDALKRGDWQAAVALLRLEESRSPRDAAIARKYGIALLGQGDAPGAIAKLSAARARAPRDRSTLYFLGRAAEAIQDDALALDAYRALIVRGGPNLAPVRARVDSLARRQALIAARAALAAEQSLRTESVPTNTISVPEFALPVAVDSLAPLARGLAEVMITDLSKVPQLRVLERFRLGVLMNEMALATSSPSAAGVAGAEAVEPGSAPRLGKLLGARRFAQGTLVPLARADVQLGASLIEVADGTQTAAGAPVAGTLPRVLELERQLVFQLLETMGIPIDPGLRRRIGPLPTQSFDAFMAYCRGLDLEARGFADDARRAYRLSLSLDPGFTLARDRDEALTVDPGAGAALNLAMIDLAAVSPPPDDRLQRGAAMAGFDAGDPLRDPGSTANTRASAGERIGFREFSIRVRFQ